jgi:hypothetical protein
MLAAAFLIKFIVISFPLFIKSWCEYALLLEYEDLFQFYCSKTLNSNLEHNFEHIRAQTLLQGLLSPLITAKSIHPLLRKSENKGTVHYTMLSAYSVQQQSSYKMLLPEKSEMLRNMKTHTLLILTRDWTINARVKVFTAITIMHDPDNQSNIKRGHIYVILNTDWFWSSGSEH